MTDPADPFEALRRRALTVDEIGASIDEILVLAKRQRFRVALAGGVAMQVHGSDRYTRDVDFLASRSPTGVKVVRPLGFGGVQMIAAADVPVDLIVRDDEWEPLYEAALRNAETVKGIPIRVITPEYMAALKLAAHRDKDMADLRFLLTEAESFDYDLARKIVARHLGLFGAGELDRYRRDCVLMKSYDDDIKNNPRGRRR